MQTTVQDIETPGRHSYTYSTTQISRQSFSDTNELPCVWDSNPRPSVFPASALLATEAAQLAEFKSSTHVYKSSQLDKQVISNFVGDMYVYITPTSDTHYILGTWGGRGGRERVYIHIYMYMYMYLEFFQGSFCL